MEAFAFLCIFFATVFYSCFLTFWVKGYSLMLKSNSIGISFILLKIITGGNNSYSRFLVMGAGNVIAVKALSLDVTLRWGSMSKFMASNSLLLQQAILLQLKRNMVMFWHFDDFVVVYNNVNYLLYDRGFLVLDLHSFHVYTVTLHWSTFDLLLTNVTQVEDIFHANCNGTLLQSGRFLWDLLLEQRKMETICTLTRPNCNELFLEKFSSSLRIFLFLPFLH